MYKINFHVYYIVLFVFLSINSYAQTVEQIFREAWDTNNDEIRRQKRKQVLELYPNTVFGLYSKAWFQRLEGKNQEFLKSSEDVIQQYPNHWLGYFSRGIAKINSQDYQGAIQDFNKAIDLKPDFVSAFGDIYARRGIAKNKLKDYHGAIQDYNKAIEIKPDDYLSFYNRGNSKSDLQDYQGAIRDYSKTIELRSDNMLAHYNRAQTKGVLQDYQGAIQDYSRAIELKPDFEGAYIGRGKYKSELKDYKGAIQDYNKAIEIKPDNALAYSNRASTKIDLQDYQGVIQDCNKAIELDPNLSYAYSNRGVAKVNFKDYKGAIQDYNKAIELDPNFATAYNNRGIAKSWLKDYKSAAQDYSKATELNANAYYNSGLTKFGFQDYQGAVQDFDKAIKLNPNYDNAKNKKAEALKKIGSLNLPTTVVAEPTKPNNNTTLPQSKVYAVVVGVTKYSDSQRANGFENLVFAHSDAEKIYQFLKSPAGGGLPDTQIRLLTNTQATHDNIIQASKELFAKASTKDRIVFYFSGHGIGEAFAAHDKNIFQQDIARVMNASPAKQRLCIADACYSGSWVKSQTATKSQALSDDEMKILFYKVLEETSQGIAILTSSQANEQSLEDPIKKQGLFTFFLIEGLKGEADKNYDKIVTIQELYQYVLSRVSERARDLGKPQNPDLKGTFDNGMPVGVTR